MTCEGRCGDRVQARQIPANSSDVSQGIPNNTVKTVYIA